MTIIALVEEWYKSESETEYTDQQHWLGWDGWVNFDDVRVHSVKPKAAKSG